MTYPGPNIYRLHLMSPGGGIDGVTLYRSGVAAVMSELRRAKAWGYSLNELEIAR